MAESVVEDQINIISNGIIDKNTILFIGSGISYNSGIPIVSQIITYLLTKLGADEKEIEIFINAGFPFEGFMEVLYEESKMGEFVNLFCQGLPNRNHLFVANLIKKNFIKALCTTNFDLLFEKAFKGIGLKQHKDFIVSTLEYPYEKGIKEECATLYKIHGCSSDPVGMQVTLKRVAQNKNNSYLENLLNFVFSTGDHEQVVIMGYSCSDRFDISPIIEAISNPNKKIFYIDHSVTEIKSDIIKFKNRANPFKNFSDGIKLTVDTDQLVEKIWKKCLPKTPMPQKRSMKLFNWKKHVDDWLIENRMHFNNTFDDMLIGKLFSRITQYEIANKYALRSVGKAKENSEDQKRLCQCLGLLGRTFSCIGKYETAIKHLNQAAEIAKNNDYQYDLENILGNTAIAYKYMGNIDACLHNENKSLEIAIKHNYIDSIIEQTINIGNTYAQKNDNHLALKYLQQAYDLALKQGYLSAEAQCLNSISIILRRDGNYIESEKMAREALSISKRIGNKEIQGLLVQNLATTYQLQNNHEAAIHYYKEAMNLMDETGHENSKLVCLMNIAGLYVFQKSNILDAKPYVRQALELAKNSMHKEYIAHSQLLMAIVEATEGNLLEAYSFIIDSIEGLIRAFGENHEKTSLAMKTKKLIEDDLRKEYGALGICSNCKKPVGFTHQEIDTLNNFHASTIVINCHFCGKALFLKKET